MLTTRETIGEGATVKGTPLTNEELDNNLLALYKLGAYTSAGMIHTPTFTNVGDGSIIVGSSSASLYSTNDFNGERGTYLIPEATLTPTDATDSYIVADYNDGTPIYKSINDVALITQSSVIPVYTVFRDGTEICSLNWDESAKGLSNKLHTRLVKTRRFERENGVLLSENNTRELTISGGVVWTGGHDTLLEDFDSAIDTCYLFTKTAAVWGKAAVTQYSNTQYQNGGNVGTLGNNNFGVIWVFKCVSSTNNIARLALGAQSYSKLADALISDVPNDLPTVFGANSILVGRVIVEKGGVVATEISSAFATTFQGSGVSDHENLTNLLGGLPSEHYHLTAAESVSVPNLINLNTANGFDLQDPDSMGTVTWDNSTRTFTIAPKSGQTSFTYWVGGTPNVETSSITSAPIPADVNETYYTYLNGLGDLIYINQSSVTLDVFYKYAITSFVYWNATTLVGKPFKEQHGHRMSSSDHEMEHNTFGARYSKGLAPTGLVTGQATFTGVNSGRFYDEDIPHNVAAAATLPFMYRNGTEGGWVWTAADNLCGFKNGTSNVCWNEDTGSGWQLTESGSSTDYMIYFLVASPALLGSSFAKIVGQAGYSKASIARDAIETERSTLILEGLPTPESCFIGAIIVKRNGDLQRLSDGSVFFDLRGTSSRGSGGASVASNVASDTIVDATSFVGNLSATDVDVQTALETLDSKYDYISASNPTVTTNPTVDYATALNTVSCELFICKDKTTDANIWVGQRGSNVP